MSNTATRKLLTVQVYGFIAKALKKKYPAGLRATLRNDIGLELVQEVLHIQASWRLFPEAPRITGAYYMMLFYAELTAWVDAHRKLGHTIHEALLSFMDYKGITEDDLSLKALTKMYDRHRTDNHDTH